MWIKPCLKILMEENFKYCHFCHDVFSLLLQDKTIMVVTFADPASSASKKRARSNSEELTKNLKKKRTTSPTKTDSTDNGEQSFTHNDDAEPEKMSESVRGEEAFDSKYSLAYGDDDVKIEPFHLKNEREGGDGYFDTSGNFVWRSHGKDGAEETDAWLESLGENVEKIQSKKENKNFENVDDDDNSDDDDGVNDEIVEEEMDDSKRLVLYRLLVSYMYPKETVISALNRLGKLTKVNRMNSNNKQNKDKNPIVVSASVKAARETFNQLTEAADALLSAGETDIYQESREMFEREVKECELSVPAPSVNYFGKDSGEAATGGGGGGGLGG